MATIVKRGDRQWQARVRRKGHSVTETFETKARAEAWARQVENDIDAARYHPTSKAAESTTLHQALETYLEERVPLKTGIKQNTGIVRIWQRTKLATRPLSSIRGSDIAEYRDEFLKTVGPQTVVHRINLISNLFNVAATEWGMEGLINPVSRVRKPSLPSGRDRRFVDKEETRLLAACDKSKSKWLGAMVRLALATAMRQGELVGLNWADIDLEKRTAILRETKNGLTRSVPLSTAARTVLEEIAPDEKDRNGKIFHIEGGRAVTHAFAKACDTAKIQDFHFHDLRHEATSRLFERTDLRDVEIASITGHKTLAMLQRYSHLRASDLADRLG